MPTCELTVLLLCAPGSSFLLPTTKILPADGHGQPSLALRRLQMKFGTELQITYVRAGSTVSWNRPVTAIWRAHAP